MRDAIAAGSVPVAYRARLTEAVRQLAGRMPQCVPLPTPLPKHEKPKPPKHDKKHDKHGKGKEG